ncbi:MAG: FtsX-like permease family protein [Planctomycetota bacterium]|nr:FtsX-like permease family protein [Planctomycetota bacterium]
MKVLDRKLLREAKASKGLILAITSLVAVGVMCFIYMRSAHRNLTMAKDQYYAQCRMADFWIDVKKVPIAELPELLEIPGLTEIQPRIQFFATVDLERVKYPLNGYVLSLPDDRQNVINDVVLKRGSYFTERRRNEVLVNDAFARKHGLHPGQWIHLILNNRREELFVVGTAISSEFVYLVSPGSITPDPERFGVFYIKHSYAEEVFDMDGACNQVVGLLSPEVRERPDEILRQIENKLDSYGVFSKVPRKDQPSSRFLNDEIRGLGVFATIMPVIFLAVAALVLNVLMARLIDQQRVIVGTLKGLGYSNLQIFGHFTKFGGLIGLIGGLLGCFFGYRMSIFITELYKQFFEFPNLSNQVSVPLYVTAMIISLLCALIGSAQGAYAALKLRPAEAMRPKPPRQGGNIWLERFPRFWNRLSFGWRMVLRNVIRNRLRSSVGLFAAIMGAALLSTGFTLQYCVRYLIDFQFEMISCSDIDLTFKDERGPDALDESRRLPGVDRAEPTLDVACELFNGPHHRKAGITGLASDARLTLPRDLDGNIIRVPKTGLLLTRKIADLLNATVGTTITIVPTKGLRTPRDVPVVAISDSYIGLGVYAKIDYLSGLIDEELAMTGVQLEMDPRTSAYDRFYTEIKQLPALQAFNERASNIKNLMETLINTQDIFIGLITLFAGVIFFSSLLNTSLIGLAERRREVATLRVLGYSQWQVGGYFLRESMILNILGTLLGQPLGYLLVRYLTVVYDTEMFRFPMIWPASVTIKTLLLGTAFALAAHVFVQREINKMDWREALNVKE